MAGARRVGRLASSIRSGDRTTEEGPTRAWPAPVTPGDRRALLREDWAHASDALLALASALLARGDARATLTVLDEAKACGERMRSDAFLIDVAVLSGHAWMDLARPDNAEGVIGTALVTWIGDGSRQPSASLALGRCLFWKGQSTDARSALALPAAHGVGPHLTVPIMAAAARAAVGIGVLLGAMALAREAMEEAVRHGDPALVARASCAAAFVHLTIGDVDAVAADVRTSIAAARAARDPMRAIRARLLFGRTPTTRPRLVVGVVHQARTGHGARRIYHQSSGRGRTWFKR